MDRVGGIRRGDGCDRGGADDANQQTGGRTSVAARTTGQPAPGDYVQLLRRERRLRGVVRRYHPCAARARRSWLSGSASRPQVTIPAPWSRGCKQPVWRSSNSTRERSKTHGANSLRTLKNDARDCGAMAELLIPVAGVHRNVAMRHWPGRPPGSRTGAAGRRSSRVSQPNPRAARSDLPRG